VLAGTSTVVITATYTTASATALARIAVKGLMFGNRTVLLGKFSQFELQSLECIHVHLHVTTSLKMFKNFYRNLSV